MTIREIAKIAGVSVSTVSKIINKKDSNISDETRQRVLQVVKEYNYSPYANLRASERAASFLIGISVHTHEGYEQLLTSIVKTARESGYSTIVCTCSDAEEEYRNLAVLCSHNVDGIIWDRVHDSSEDGCTYIEKQGIPLQVIDSHGDPAEDILSIDYKSLGYALTEKLAERRHCKLICLLEENGAYNHSFTTGFQQCLFDHRIPYDDNMLRVWNRVETQPLLLHNYTGVVCINHDLASQVYKQASDLNLSIPRDLSLVCLDSFVGTSERISAITLPYDMLGLLSATLLIGKMESRDSGPAKQRALTFNHGNSIDIPRSLRGNKIVVMGPLNMDTLISFQKMPEMGETVTAEKRALIPGGKGLNQALAASKLGADTYLIGKVGKDHDGSLLYDYLKLNNVNIDGVSTSPNTSTGHAYIYIRGDGESSIVVYRGANRSMSNADIDEHAEVFRNASFCLLQTELDSAVVAYAAKTARRYGTKVILKPCVVSELSDELLENVDILLPNKMEVNRLLPALDSYEDQAQYYLDKGVGIVIITLGHRGCYLRDAARSVYFPAADIVPVDTTGAADAFAATLAVYLAKKHSLETAICYATWAAGLSTTRQGVPPSLVDQDTLNLYLTETDKLNGGTL